MRRCLELAEQAATNGEVPVGAVVTRADAVLGEGHNSPIAMNDPSAHAEIVALRQAASRWGNYRLTGCTLYVSLEPCAMCVGAMVQARISRLVFAAREPKSGAVVSCAQLLDAPWHNHRVHWSEGEGRERSVQLLRQFFSSRRSNS